MKKLIILLVLALGFALPAVSQTDSAFNNVFNFTPQDSVRGIEGKDFKEGVVFIYLDKQQVNLYDFLKDLKKTDPILKGPVANTLLDTLGIQYSLIAFSKSMNLVAVATKPGQSVKVAIADIKKSAKVKIKSIEPDYYEIIYD